MAYLTQADFNTVIRQYQLDAILDGDETILPTAIDIGIEEVRDIFTPNDMNKWKDGRPIYDIDAVFQAEGDQRHALLLAYTKIVVLWQLILICNTGLVYGEVKDRYDRTIMLLKELASGDSNSSTLPKIAAPEPDDELPWRSGSRRKFNHE